MPDADVTVYKWVVEKGFGAGDVFPRRGPPGCCPQHWLLRQSFVEVSWQPPMTSPQLDAMWFLNHGTSRSLPKSFRDICWPEAVLRAWTGPAPHPGVRAPGMFPASTAEGGRLTCPAVQININSLDFVFWTIRVNCVVRLLLAITCLLFPPEVTHAPTQSFGLRDKFIGETRRIAIVWSYLRLILAADLASLFRKCLWQDCNLRHSAMLFPLVVLGLSLPHAFSCAAG